MNGNIKRDTPCSIAMSHFVVTPVAEVPNEVSSPPGPEHAAAATVDPVAEHDSDMVLSFIFCYFFFVLPYRNSVITPMK